jgi:voltage-gated potassium channel
MTMKAILRGIVFISTLLIIGTLFYMSFENLSFVNAFYLSGSSLTTLGFGDIVPVTDVGKIFTVLYTVVGIGSIFYISGEIVNNVIQSKKLDIKRKKRGKILNLK